MGQMTFTDTEYANRKKISKREQFLSAIDKLLLWDDWGTMIEPHYYHNKVGRPAIGIEKMLRMYLLQCWFNLSGENLEFTINDSFCFSRFMGINFLDGQAPERQRFANSAIFLRRITWARKYLRTWRSGWRGRG